MKKTVLCDVYILTPVDIYLCPPTSSTDKPNTNNNKLAALGIVALDPMYICIYIYIYYQYTGVSLDDLLSM